MRGKVGASELRCKMHAISRTTCLFWLSNRRHLASRSTLPGLSQLLWTRNFCQAPKTSVFLQSFMRYFDAVCVDRARERIFLNIGRASFIELFGFRCSCHSSISFLPHHPRSPSNVTFPYTPSSLPFAFFSVYVYFYIFYKYVQRGKEPHCHQLT